MLRRPDCLLNACHLLSGQIVKHDHITFRKGSCIKRNLIGRIFSQIKYFRRVAGRYDKPAANFLVMVQLASVRLWRRAYESTSTEKRT